MHRASHRPCANNLSIGERPLDIGFDRVPHAQSDRPERAEIILSLDGAHPRHDFGRPIESGAGNALVMEPETRDIRVCHKASFELQWPFCRLVSALSLFAEAIFSLFHEERIALTRISKRSADQLSSPAAPEASRPTARRKS